MRNSDAKYIAEHITNAQIFAMLEKAKAYITDWSVPSKVNKSCSIGTAWNVLTDKGKFDINNNYSLLATINLIREFGQFLDDDLKPDKKEKKPVLNYVHQEPIF